MFPAAKAGAIFHYKGMSSCKVQYFTGITGFAWILPAENFKPFMTGRRLADKDILRSNASLQNLSHQEELE